MNSEGMVTDVVDYNEAFKISNVLEFKEKNLCNNCAKLLNISPIYCLQTEGKGQSTIVAVCGRCLHITKKHGGKKWRQKVYENAAKFMTFPCSFKNEGCDLIVPWTKVLDHEMGCPNASVNCPAPSGTTNSVDDDNDLDIGFPCPWKGNIGEVEKHIKQVHQESVLDPPYLEQLPRTSEIYFTHVNTKLATIVILRSDDRKYYCCVLLNVSDLESQYYQYQVELIDESKENSIILRRNRLEPFGNLQAILANKERLLEINIDAIEAIIKTSTEMGKRISLKFGIVRKSKNEMRQVAEANGVKWQTQKKTAVTSNKKHLPPDEHLLIELECPVCNEFMVPPIYICNNGHSFCSECLEKVQSCPNCRSSLEQKTRNFTLEKLTTKIRYPCKNRDIGCEITDTSDKIRHHDNVCDFTGTPCFLKCGLTFRKPAIYNHINDVHSEHIFQLNVTYSRDIHERKEANFAVYSFGQIFRLSIKGGMNSSYKFNLQHMGKENDEPDYRYKLEIIDQSDLELNVTVTSVVQPLSDTPTKTNPVTIPWDLVKTALVDNKVFYRINMSVVTNRK